MGVVPHANPTGSVMIRRRHRGGAVVAAYGPKEPHVAGWLSWLHDQISTISTVPFEPRNLNEIHSTIIGLENPIRPVGVSDVLGMRDAIVERLGRPVRLQFGGYPTSFDRFKSRGVSPHNRTYSITNGVHVIVGWPATEEGIEVTTLGLWRRDLERFGFCHRYHRDGGPDDFDAYMVIGKDGSGTQATGQERVGAVRRLASSRALMVDLDITQLGFALYDENTLACLSTDYIKLLDLDTDGAKWILECVSGGIRSSHMC